MFKNYTSNDNLLLPPCLGDFIPQNDPVRVVHRIIEQINLEELYRRYSPKGCSAYHPRMMLQILVYAYLRNIYSSRRIEEFCRNDIRFMWLTGNVTPDHNTINRFRSSRLKDVLKTIFQPAEGRTQDNICHHREVPRGGRFCKSGCGLYRRDEDGGGRQPLYVRLGQVHTYAHIQNRRTA